MDENAIGDLVFRILGDASNYLSMLDNALRMTEQTTAKIKGSLDTIGVAFEKQGDAWDTLSDSVDKYTKSLENLEEAQRGQSKAFDTYANELIDANHEIQDVQRATLESTVTMERGMVNSYNALAKIRMTAAAGSLVGSSAVIASTAVPAILSLAAAENKVQQETTSAVLATNQLTLATRQSTAAEMELASAIARTNTVRSSTAASAPAPGRIPPTAAVAPPNPTISGGATAPMAIPVVLDLSKFHTDLSALVAVKPHMEVMVEANDAQLFKDIVTITSLKPQVMVDLVTGSVADVMKDVTFLTSMKPQIPVEIVTIPQPDPLGMIETRLNALQTTVWKTEIHVDAVPPPDPFKAIEDRFTQLKQKAAQTKIEIPVEEMRHSPPGTEIIKSAIEQLKEWGDKQEIDILVKSGGMRDALKEAEAVKAALVALRASQATGSSEAVGMASAVANQLGMLEGSVHSLSAALEEQEKIIKLHADTTRELEKVQGRSAGKSLLERATGAGVERNVGTLVSTALAGLNAFLAIHGGHGPGTFIGGAAITTGISALSTLVPRIVNIFKWLVDNTESKMAAHREAAIAHNVARDKLQEAVFTAQFPVQVKQVQSTDLEKMAEGLTWMVRKQVTDLAEPAGAAGKEVMSLIQQLIALQKAVVETTVTVNLLSRASKQARLAKSNRREWYQEEYPEPGDLGHGLPALQNIPVNIGPWNPQLIGARIAHEVETQLYEHASTIYRGTALGEGPQAELMDLNNVLIPLTEQVHGLVGLFGVTAGDIVDVNASLVNLNKVVQGTTFTYMELAKILRQFIFTTQSLVRSHQLAHHTFPEQPTEGERRALMSGEHVAPEVLSEVQRMMRRVMADLMESVQDVEVALVATLPRVKEMADAITKQALSTRKMSPSIVKAEQLTSSQPGVFAPNIGEVGLEIEALKGKIREVQDLFNSLKNIEPAPGVAKFIEDLLSDLDRLERRVRDVRGTITGVESTLVAEETAQEAAARKVAEADLQIEMAARAKARASTEAMLAAREEAKANQELTAALAEHQARLASAPGKSALEWNREAGRTLPQTTLSDVFGPSELERLTISAQRLQKEINAVKAAMVGLEVSPASEKELRALEADLAGIAARLQKMAGADYLAKIGVQIKRGSPPQNEIVQAQIDAIHGKAVQIEVNLSDLDKLIERGSLLLRIMGEIEQINLPSAKQIAESQIGTLGNTTGRARLLTSTTGGETSLLKGADERDAQVEAVVNALARMVGLLAPLTKAIDSVAVEASGGPLARLASQHEAINVMQPVPGGKPTLSPNPGEWDEAIRKTMELDRVFSYAIADWDRNIGNFLVDMEGRLWAIDRTMAFTRFGQPAMAGENLGTAGYGPEQVNPEPLLKVLSLWHTLIDAAQEFGGSAVAQNVTNRLLNLKDVLTRGIAAGNLTPEAKQAGEAARAQAQAIPPKTSSGSWLVLDESSSKAAESGKAIAEGVAEAVGPTQQESAEMQRLAQAAQRTQERINEIKAATAGMEIVPPETQERLKSLQADLAGIQARINSIKGITAKVGVEIKHDSPPQNELVQQEIDAIHGKTVEINLDTPELEAVRKSIEAISVDAVRQSLEAYRTIKESFDKSSFGAGGPATVTRVRMGNLLGPETEEDLKYGYDFRDMIRMHRALAQAHSDFAKEVIANPVGLVLVEDVEKFEREVIVPLKQVNQTLSRIHQQVFQELINQVGEVGETGANYLTSSIHGGSFYRYDLGKMPKAEAMRKALTASEIVSRQMMEGDDSTIVKQLTQMMAEKAAEVYRALIDGAVQGLQASSENAAKLSEYALGLQTRMEGPEGKLAKDWPHDIEGATTAEKHRTLAETAADTAQARLSEGGAADAKYLEFLSDLHRRAAMLHEELAASTGTVEVMGAAINQAAGATGNLAQGAARTASAFDQTLAQINVATDLIRTLEEKAAGNLAFKQLWDAFISGAQMSDEATAKVSAAVDALYRKILIAQDQIVTAAKRAAEATAQIGGGIRGIPDVSTKKVFVEEGHHSPPGTVAIPAAIRAIPDNTVKKVYVDSPNLGNVASGFNDLYNTASRLAIAFGTLNWARNAVHTFAELEIGIFKLKGALESVGEDVDSNISKFEEFGEKLRDFTGSSKVATNSLLQYGMTLGMTPDQAKEAVVASEAVATSMGGTAHTYIRMIRAIQEGNAHMIYHLPVLMGIRDEGEKLAKAQEIVNMALKAQAAAAESTQITLKRFQGVMYDLRAEFGRFISEAIKPVIGALTALVEGFLNLDENTKRLVASIAMVGAALMLFNSSILRYLYPIISVFTGGFRAIGAAILFLVNPLSIVSGIIATVSAVFSPLGAILAGVAGAVVLLITELGGLGPAWKAVTDVFSNLKGISTSIWTGIEGAATATWEGIKSAVYNAYRFIAGIIQSLRPALIMVWDGVRTAAVAVWDYIIGAVQSAYKWVKEFIAAHPTLISYLGNLVTIVASIAAAWRSLPLVAAVLGPIIALFGQLYGVLKLIGSLILVVFTPWGAILAAVAGATAYWATQLGGLSATLNVLGAAAYAAGLLIQSVWNYVGGGVGIWNAIRSAATGFWDLIVRGAVGAYEAVREFIISNSDLIKSLGGLLLIAGGVVLVIKAIGLAISVTTGLLSLLHVQQLLSAAGWVAWQAGLLVAAGAMTYFNAIKSIGVAISGAVDAAIALETIGWTFFSTAVTAANVAMGVFIGLGAIAAAIPLAAALMAIASASIAVYTAVESIVEAFTSLGAATGIFADIGGIFSQWRDILVDVWKIAQNDIPTAGRLLAATFKLAIAQVQAMWPPLWGAISGGFVLVWAAVKEEFIMQFDTMMQRAMNQLAQLKRTFLAVGTLGISNLFTEPAGTADKEIAELAKAREAETRARATRLANDLAELFKKARVPVDDEGIKRLTKNVEDLRKAGLDLAGQAKPGRLLGLDDMLPSFDITRKKHDFSDLTKGITSGFTESAKAVHELRVALLGTADAMKNTYEYMEIITKRSLGEYKGSAEKTALGPLETLQNKARDLADKEAAAAKDVADKVIGEAGKEAIDAAAREAAKIHDERRKVEEEIKNAQGEVEKKVFSKTKEGQEAEAAANRDLFNRAMDTVGALWKNVDAFEAVKVSAEEATRNFEKASEESAKFNKQIETGEIEEWVKRVQAQGEIKVGKFSQEKRDINDKIIEATNRLNAAVAEGNVEGIKAINEEIQRLKNAMEAVKEVSEKAWKEATGETPRKAIEEKKKELAEEVKAAKEELDRANAANTSVFTPWINQVLPIVNVIKGIKDAIDSISGKDVPVRPFIPRGSPPMNEIVQAKIDAIHGKTVAIRIECEGLDYIKYEIESLLLRPVKLQVMYDAVSPEATQHQIRQLYWNPLTMNLMANMLASVQDRFQNLVINSPILNPKSEGSAGGANLGPSAANPIEVLDTSNQDATAGHRLKMETLLEAILGEIRKQTTKPPVVFSEANL